MAESEPGPVSPCVYYFRNGNYHHIDSNWNGDQLRVGLPQALADVMAELGAPPQ